MAWMIKTLQKIDINGNPAGIWHLCAESDEDGGFHAGCNHQHKTPLEAQECPEAKERIGAVTGFPAKNESNEDAEIKRLVNRFLSWKLPEDFAPDGGISFEPWINVNTPFPLKCQPTGTNLFNADQAEAMIRHMLKKD